MFTNDYCYLQGSSLKKPLALGKSHKGLYIFPPSDKQDSIPSSIAFSSVCNQDVIVWHIRLGHLP